MTCSTHYAAFLKYKTVEENLKTGPSVNSTTYQRNLSTSELKSEQICRTL